MLQLTIKGQELWDNTNREFVYTEEHTILLEHSLVSLSKWESIWKKPFLSTDNKTREEFISYIKCMTITQNVPDKVYLGITNSNIKKITEYIEDSMTATWFRKDDKRPGSRKVITSEVIYSWMAAGRIPFKPCEQWHLNRLLTLIRVVNEQNNPKKQSRQDTYKTNAEINKARREKLHSKG